MFERVLGAQRHARGLVVEIDELGEQRKQHLAFRRLERLVAKKLIDRKPSGEDKRVKLLYLTKAGVAMLREIMPSVEKAQARILQPLKPSDRKVLLSLLTQLVDLNNESSRVPLRAEDALEHLGRSG